MNPRHPNHFLSILMLCISCTISQVLLATKETKYHQLEQRLKTSKPDRQKVDQLVGLCKQYIYYWNFRKADSTASIVYEIANKLGYETGVADFHHIKGIVLTERHQYSEALEQQRIALKVYYKKKDYNRLAECYIAIGTIYDSWGKLNNALNPYQKALYFYQKAGNKVGIAHAEYEIGDVFYDMEYWDLSPRKAITHWQRAMSMFRELNNPEGIAKVSNGMAWIYSRHDRFDLAQECLDEAASIHKANSDSANLTYISGTQAMIHRLQKNYKSAISEMLRAARFWKKTNVAGRLGSCYHELGIVYNEMGKVDSAAYYFRKDLEIAKKINNTPNLANSYYWASVGDTATGDYKKGYRYLHCYLEFRALAASEKISAHIISANAKYEANQRQVRMTDLDFRQRTGAANLERQQIYLYTLAGGVVLVAIIAILIYFQLRNRQRNRLITAERDRVLEEQKALNYRLQALSSQMNPHFIFNSLTSIQRFMLSNDIDNSNRYLGDFSRLMRQTLENSQEATVSLADEIEMLMTYLKLEQMRTSDKFDFEISVDQTIDIDATHIPTLLIQPYAENAIWHGIGDDKMLLHIHIYPNKDLICCSIDDNGVGRPKDIIQRKRKSFGMSITKTRLELINILEEGQVNVQVTDKVDKDGRSMGTKVQICFPNDL